MTGCQFCLFRHGHPVAEWIITITGLSLVSKPKVDPQLKHGKQAGQAPALSYKKGDHIMLKVAINGFGRIGRLSFRKIFGDDRFDVGGNQRFNRS